MDQSAAFNISTIAKMVGSDLVEPMLVSYQETMQAQLTKLITIVATQSTSELHRLAHSIKSSAKFIGSDALSEFCFQLEMKTAADPEWHSDYARQVEELCQRSRDVLEQVTIYLELSRTAKSE
ncbi:Hpt domain-containing protein [Vibrio cholerae]|nr:Hpt domain-containing protein [Vibrio cholerae]EJL6561404.1 Hpt domain-containing protein [Vibrio cholerae]